MASLEVVKRTCAIAPRLIRTLDLSTMARWQLVFPPGKSGREISRFSGNSCRHPGKFFYVSKDFSCIDIYHSDIKNALLQILIFFLLTKNYF